MDVPENILIYLAMVAIIFVRWLLNQIKEASVKREARRRQLRRSWDEPNPEAGSLRSPGGTHTPPPLPPRLPSQPQTLQELFEQKRQEIAESQRRMTPPPIVVEKKPVAAVTTPAPVKPKAHPPIRVKQAQPVKARTLSQKSQPLKKARAQTAQVEVSRIGKLFSDRNQMRNAIIIKEVIDKPKGFDD